jgi:hypothetical protein
MKPLEGLYQFAFEQPKAPEGLTLFPIEEKKITEEDWERIRNSAPTPTEKQLCKTLVDKAMTEMRLGESRDEIMHQRRIIAVLLHKLGGKVEIDARDIAELGKDTINMTRSFEGLNWMMWVGDSPFPPD